MVIAVTQNDGRMAKCQENMHTEGEPKMKKCNKRAELSGRTLTGTTVFVAIAALCMVAASMPSWAATHDKIGADTGRIPVVGLYRW